MSIQAKVVLPSVPSTAAPNPWGVFFVSSVAVFLVSMDATLLYAAFGAVRAGFPNATAADLSWVINAYTVVYAALLVPAGRLVDAHGRRRVFLAGLVIFLAASAGCGFAPTVGTLVGARVAQAVGAALLTPSSLALVIGAFPTERRAIAISLWGAVGGLAAALGPSLGSGVIALMGWRWAFFINLPLGALAWWQGRKRLSEWRSSTQSRQPDAVGIGLLMISVGAMAYGIVQIESLGWRSSIVHGAVATGIVLLGVFVAWAQRVAHPVVDLSLFDDRTYRFVNLATFVFGVAFALMFFGYFFFLIQVWNYSLPRAGLAVAPGPLLVVPVALFAGRWAARIGHRPLLVTGCLLYAAGGLWLYQRTGVEPDYVGTWLPGLVITGVAVGMVLPSLGGAAVARLSPEYFGVGSAVNQAVRQIGGVLGVAVTVTLVGHASPQVTDFHTLYLTHVALALCAALFSLRVDTRPTVRR